MSLLTSSEAQGWYIPPATLDAARQTLGGIELDPTNSPAANHNVKVQRFFTIEDDDLAQP